MITFITETGSTNTDLAARIASGADVAEGDWLVTDRQWAGKGRQGRAWLDQAGNFMGSTVVHRRFGDPPATSLSLLAGLAVWAVVSEILLNATSPSMPARGSAGAAPAMLKWPNDVMVGPAKLAGILLEAAGDAVIAGIGVNLQSAPQVPGRQTIALDDMCADMPSRDSFAAMLARQFDLELVRWRDFGMDLLVRRWTAAAHPPGTALLVGDGDGASIAGTFAGLSADGALQLRLADGTTHTIHAGDVRLAET